MTCTDQRIPPMGSEALDTNFTEHLKMTHCVPPYEIWKNSFQDLLDDHEGYKLFYEFLEKEQLVVLFDCWYCCCQYRKSAPNKATAKDVFTRFVKSKHPRIPISDQARNNLYVRLKANDITKILLEEVEQEVYGNLRDICYPTFLKSDFFNLYCETSGHVPYSSTEFYSKFDKPSHNANILHSVNEHVEPVASSGRPSNYGYEHHEHVSMHHDRGGYAPAHRPNDDLHSLPSDSFDYDRTSMTDSKISMGSNGRHGRPSRSHNHDVMDVVNFQPRTQRINQQMMKQMKPADFAALLTEKLENVIRERKAEEPHHSEHSLNMTSMKQNLPTSYSHQRAHSNNNSQYSHEYDLSECDAQSWIMSDRPSVAGQSSHSGSHSGIMVNKKAKELRNIVHHQLRSDLKECKCENCLQIKYRDHCRRGASSTHSGSRSDSHNYINSSRQHAQHGYYPQSSHSYQHSSDHTVEDINRHNLMTSSHHRDGRSTAYHRDPYEIQDIVPPVDNSKIVRWMEKNEQYQKEEFANPSPSPSVRRKKRTPIQYNTSRSVAQAVQPIAQDTGMPILPQPDPENILQEVKRVLEEPHQQHHYRTNHYQAEMHDKHSMISAPWPMSDAASVASYNPSQISTVPSSASRLWNAQGYFNNGSEVRDERCTPSEVQSSASKHSGGQRSLTRNDRVSGARSDHYSDVRSQSTGRSYGSDGSKGRSGSKNKTVVTYYFGGEPIPYRINIPSTDVTLGQFKAEFKRGSYRFFFKTISSVDGETVYEEVRNDDDPIPRYKDRIVGKVEKI